MVRICALSDTHMPSRARSFPAPMVEALKRADRIIHAGDLVRDFVLYELQEYAPVDAVAGNNDDSWLVSQLPMKRILQIEGCTLGITHGHGYGLSTPERAKRMFSAEKLDCIIFGHSHIPFCETVNGVLLLNPGSPTDKRMQPMYSFAELVIDQKLLQPQIVYFK